SELMLVTKVDLLPYMDFNIENAISSAKKVNPKIDIIKVSSKTGEGMELWIDYLRFKLKILRNSLNETSKGKT
ncbi:MAG TPA: hydrogenase accessory protein HypB, partial [Aquifex aeolicus]|nr:hydrogenase accessory protein HypB [Aquifex aeolicus]